MGLGYSKQDRAELEDIFVPGEHGDDPPSRVEILTRLLNEKQKRGEDKLRDDDDVNKVGFSKQINFAKRKQMFWYNFVEIEMVAVN